MSGPENIRGIDYQVSYTILRVLEELSKVNRDLIEVQVESLDDTGEDLNLFFFDGISERIQLKKKSEGYQWTPSELKPILSNFIQNNGENVRFAFVTNGPASRDVKSLKEKIEKGNVPEDKFLKKFCTKELEPSDIKSIMSKLAIITRAYSSDDDNDPARLIKEQIKKILMRPPFLIEEDLETVFSKLWKYFFDLSKRADVTPVKEIEEHFKMLGVTLAFDTWLNLPLPEVFLARMDAKNELSDIIKNSSCSLVYGVTGTGKSALLAQIAADFHETGQSVCWINVNPFVSISRLATTFSHCLRHHGYIDDAEIVLSTISQSDEFAEQIVKILKRLPIILFIDSLNSGNESLQQFSKIIHTSCIDKNLVGGIVMSSTDITKFTFARDDNNQNVISYQVPALDILEIREIFESIDNTFSDEFLFELKAAVGGHFQSILLIKNLMAEGKEIDISDLSARGVSHAQNWLFTEVLNNLDEKYRILLLSCAVFDYPFGVDIAEIFNSSEVSAVHLLNQMVNLGLVQIEGSEFFVHDSIRSIAFSLNSQKTQKKIRQSAEAYYRECMEKERGDGDGILYSTIAKWGDHVEALAEFGESRGRIGELVELSSSHLDALWAIRRFGHPFEFTSSVEIVLEDEKLRFDLIVTDLIKNGFVKHSGEDLEISNLDEFDLAFLVHLCLSREVSGHLGYIAEFRPNAAFEEQDLICPWEHCIELMPLPPISKSDLEDHKLHLQNMFDGGEYDNFSPEHENFLRTMLEEPIPDDAPEEVDRRSLGGCPMFGHYCPGGPEQAELCWEAEDEEV